MKAKILFPIAIVASLFMPISCATKEKATTPAPLAAPPQEAASEVIASDHALEKKAAEEIVASEHALPAPANLLYVPQLPQLPLLSLPALPPQEAELPPMPSPALPASPYSIMGQGGVGEERLAAFLLGVNHSIDPGYVRNLAKIYVEEANAEGVNYETAFVQMCLETGYLRFGGLVTPDMNNFGGLGATGRERGLFFPSIRIGVRAQIQHLKAYATAAPPKRELVDPRYSLVRYGCAPTVDGLSGTWAADKEYGAKLRRLLDWLRNSK